MAGPLQSAIFERSGTDRLYAGPEGEQLEGCLGSITRQNVMLRIGDQTETGPLAKEMRAVAPAIDGLHLGADLVGGLLASR